MLFVLKASIYLSMAKHNNNNTVTRIYKVRLPERAQPITAGQWPPIVIYNDTKLILVQQADVC